MHRRNWVGMLGRLALAVVVVACWALRSRAAVTAGGDTTLGGPAQSTYIGRTTAGTLVVDGGSSLSGAEAWVGYGDAGAVTVSGNGSAWMNTGDLNIGFLGNGDVRIEAGGRVENAGGFVGLAAGAVGSVTVTGPQSTWASRGTLGIGYGMLTVDAGGQATSNSGQIGCAMGSPRAVGSVTVQGTGSKWAVGTDVQVGAVSPGTLWTASGAVVTARNFYIGAGEWTGTATIAGTGSAWTALGTVTVSNGTLLIESGGLVSSYYGYVASAGAATATLTVTGAGSLWTTTAQSIRIAGAAILNVESGGLVDAPGVELVHGGGLLRIESGGRVTTGGAKLGYRNLAKATLSVRGTGSALLCSGPIRADRADVTVDAGGRITSSGVYVGGAQGSAITVRGAGASWADNSGFFFSGSGSLSVGAGDNVSTTAAHFDSGTVTVTGSGAALVISEGMWVGYGADGTLLVDSGGSVASGGTWIGSTDDDNDTVIVTGAGSNWTSTGALTLGNGTLRVQDGGMVRSAGARVGVYRDTIGTVTVTGAGASWNNGSAGISVGGSGSGTLTVLAGGQVTSGASAIGTATLPLTSGGTAVVGGAGSLWTVGGQLTVGQSGAATLTVEDGGQVKSAGGVIGQWSRRSGSTTVRGIGSAWDAGAADTLTVGDDGIGILTVEDGGQVTSGVATVGLRATAVGAATVTGAGSAWSCAGRFMVGAAGAGTVTVSAGGRLNTETAHLGNAAGATGAVTVTGAGSTWSNAEDLFVSDSGRGTLTVADGGRVRAKALAVRGAGVLLLHVSGDGMVLLGGATAPGKLVNDGTVAVYADAFLNPGVFSPVVESAGRAMTWTGAGTVIAVGGTWDGDAHTLTVPAATPVAAGTPDAVTLGERLLITDPATGERAGASFGDVPPGTSFSAAPMADGQLAGLLAVLGPDSRVLAAWDFSTDFAGGEVLLSYDIGPGAGDLSVWHLQDGTWSPYAPGLLTYDADGVASFTVTSFSGYAVVAPEPVGLALLALAAAGGLLLRRRRPTA